MRSIVECINENLELDYPVNEGLKFKGVEVFDLSRMLQGAENLVKRYRIDPKDWEFVKKHCKFIAPGGGESGNRKSSDEYLESVGVDMDAILDLYGEDRYWFDNSEWVYDVLPQDQEITDQKILKILGKAAGMPNPKTGASYYVAGYESPLILLFDVNNSLVKDLINNLDNTF